MSISSKNRWLWSYFYSKIAFQDNLVLESGLCLRSGWNLDWVLSGWGTGKYHSSLWSCCDLRIVPLCFPARQIWMHPLNLGMVDQIGRYFCPSGSPSWFLGESQPNLHQEAFSWKFELLFSLLSRCLPSCKWILQSHLQFFAPSSPNISTCLKCAFHP